MFYLKIVFLLLLVIPFGIFLLYIIDRLKESGKASDEWESKHSASKCDRRKQRRQKRNTER